MPPSRSAAASRVRTRTSPRPGAATPGARRISGPRRLIARAPRTRVRWDRVGRVALVLVLLVVAGLYVQHALAYLSARSQFNRQGAAVRQLERSNAALRRQEQALHDPATILLDARRLGMVRPGERAYVIPGAGGP
jgi:cell division protein FtsB